jgi:Domain of unknown function (DUF4184)
MPTPIAHPAASIPFTKVGLVFSALVAGSLSPDFGYFVDLPGYFFMYTIPGLMLFDLPVGLALLGFFHILIKWPLLSLLPSSLQRRLFKHAQGFSFGPLNRFLLILLSLLVGSITHVILDSFTHDYGWMVEHFSVFRSSLRGVPLYTVLQNLGSLLGIAILIYWFVRWLPTAPQSDQLPPRFSGKFQTIFFALATVSLAAVEGRIIYLRLLTGSRLAGHHLLMFSTIFSAVFIISFFAGIYCVLWMITFYKLIRSASASN